MRSTVAAELRRARPRRGTPEETRSRLVAAAAHEFNVRGYHGTDSNRIATRAGYAAGTFYKHFADKREAFLAAYEAWVTTEWAAVGRELDSARLGRDVAAERIVELVLAHHARWHGLRSALAALLAQDADVRRFHREQRRRQLDLLAVMRRRTGSAARSAEEDALLLFTLERACDAMASGEARDLGIDETALRRLLRDAVARAITDSAPRRPRVRR